jgi:3-oxoacyl-[acyl-carrier protein] reductase
MLPDDPELREQIRSWIPVGRFGRPEEAADLALAVLRNPYVTNASLSVDGGVHPT